MPYIDIFFDSFFLDNKRNYDKIDIFLRPLVENEFGMIFSAQQVHYLHSNFLLYFKNIMSLRTTDNRDIKFLQNLMNLHELQGIGVYSRTRNQTYQIHYLKNMKDNEVIVKREDIEQPFPGDIDFEDIATKPVMLYEQIIRYMKLQGYDLKFSERKIIERAKKTIFEIDLGHYFVYIEAIINFLDEVKTVDQIGNLYKHKLKTQLKEILYPILSQKTNKKEQIKRIRDEILNILIKQGYLVENYPQRASGSEALRTSYSIGERYEKALQDYIETKGNAEEDIEVSIMEKGTTSETYLKDIFQSQSRRRYIIPKKDLKQALMRELSDFNYDLFNAYLNINKENYEKALKIEHGLIKRYLINVCRHYYDSNEKLIVNLSKFLTTLEETEGFPLTKQDLVNYIDKHQIIKGEDEDLEIISKDLYQKISDFFKHIQNYVYQEGEKK
jgi:hypothetical protein